jgi:hypothetical protein
VLIPPEGYLQRLRAACDRHGILLIFDEVITGFGRIGRHFGSERLGVTPDILTMAKGLTNAAVPMGGVAVSRDVYDTIVKGTPGGIEFMHGYTYSGHPLASAAALATIDLHIREDLPGRVREIEPYWEEAVHSMRSASNVVDIRNHGLIAGIELAPRAGKPGERAMAVFRRCFDDGPAGARDGRHRGPVAAAHHREAPRGPHRFHAGRCDPQGSGLGGLSHPLPPNLATEWTAFRGVIHELRRSGQPIWEAADPDEAAPPNPKPAK